MRFYASKTPSELGLCRSFLNFVFSSTYPHAYRRPVLSASTAGNWTENRVHPALLAGSNVQVDLIRD